MTHYKFISIWRCIIINDHIKVRCRGNICYIYNMKLKRHIFISKEVLQYVEYYKKILDKERFLSKFKKIEDKIYIEKVLTRLESIEYLPKIEKVEVLNKNYINDAYFLLTKRCNLNCLHCSTSCSKNEKDYLSFEKAKRVIDNLALLNVSNIIFSGGEPLLYKYFYDLIKYANSKLVDKKFTLSTNATLINFRNVDFLIKNFNRIEISLDGIDSKTCSKIRGKGVFEKVLDAIKLLQNRGFNEIGISTVVGVGASDYIKKFKKLNEKLGTKPIIRAFEPVGRGKQNKRYFYDQDTVLPMSIPEIYKNENEHSRDISSCSCEAFKSILFVDYFGDVYPCVSLTSKEFYIDNFSEKEININEFLRKKHIGSLKFSEKIKFKDTQCENCDINVFCWNCPAHFLKAKEHGEIDKWCKMMKSNLERIVWNQI